MLCGIESGESTLRSNMLAIQEPQSNKYHEGAYEMFGYRNRNDVVFIVFRNCLISVEENPKISLSNTAVGLSKYPYDYKINAALINGVTAMGYFPVLSWISAFKNFYVAFADIPNSPHEDPVTWKKMRLAAIVRGIFEIFCLGSLIAPVDIFVTVKRKKNPACLDGLNLRAKTIFQQQVKQTKPGGILTRKIPRSIPTNYR
jgi:hypothetical protein